jgi:uncharacterized protein
MFDEKTQQELKSYVYMLLDPQDNLPFYVGKGNNNRIFEHIKCALKDSDISTFKYDKIREIKSKEQMIRHVIVRHGLTDKEAFQIEASLIDTLNYCRIGLLNQQGGHNSIEKGLMTSDEIIQKYNAKPLDNIPNDFVIININSSYNKLKKNARNKGVNIDQTAIYQATKETWFISKDKVNQLKYVLSEYKGLIVEVFKVDENGWYVKQRGKNKTVFDKNKMPILDDKGNKEKAIVLEDGFGFNGLIAPDEIRNLYIYKSVAHRKTRGQANAIRYNL